MEEGLPIIGRMSPGSQGVLIMLGSILLVTLIIFIWIAQTRSRATEPHKGRQQTRKPKTQREQFKRDVEGIKKLIDRHHRHRERKQRPTNPTIAQVGGFSPARPPRNPPPPA